MHRFDRLLFTSAVGIFVATIISCVSPRVAYKQGFDFKNIKSVTVGQFSSSRDDSNSGHVVASEFIRQLLAMGYAVKTSEDEGTEFILTGSVTEYFPNRRYLIMTGEKESQQDDSSNKESNQKIVITQQQIELSGTSVFNLGSAFGLEENNNIIVSNATVGVSAYLKDVKSGEVVWSNSYTYEGLDLNTALEVTVASLLRSWK